MTGTAQSEVARLPVPGARLHYKIRGNGPLLLLLQGGDGDADGTDALTDHLTSRYTVLSYDRRGLSRSPASDPAAAIDIATHSEDASRLLAALTSDPALVPGTSIGAVPGLDLISRHPGQVRLLVAHEPSHATPKITVTARSPAAYQHGRSAGVVDCLACTSPFLPNRHNPGGIGGQPSATLPLAGMASPPGKSGLPS